MQDLYVHGPLVAKKCCESRYGVYVGPLMVATIFIDRGITMESAIRLTPYLTLLLSRLMYNMKRDYSVK